MTTEQISIRNVSRVAHDMQACIQFHEVDGGLELKFQARLSSYQHDAAGREFSFDSAREARPEVKVAVAAFEAACLDGVKASVTTADGELLSSGEIVTRGKVTVFRDCGGGNLLQVLAEAAPARESAA